MIDTKKIIEAAERNLQGTDMYVVGCTCTPGNDIELLIDSDTSVAIDACVRLSRSIEEELDRDEEDFSLTVASAGIGSELKCLRQYRKLVGSTVEVLHPLLRGEAGRRRQKTQATGDGDAPLRLQRNQVRAGVAGFQIGTRAGQPRTNGGEPQAKTSIN